MEYFGPGDNTDNGSMYLEYMNGADGFIYHLTDIDGNGRDELMIATPAYYGDGTSALIVDAFVVADESGDYHIVTSSWTRNNVEYIGGGHFLRGSSLGAACHVSTLYSYDPDTYSLVTDAEFVSESEEPDPSQLPIFYYSLFEGCSWSYTGTAYEDPSALHDEAAENRWDELCSAGGEDITDLMESGWYTAGNASVPTPPPAAEPAETSAEALPDSYNGFDLTVFQCDDVRRCAIEYLEAGNEIEYMSSEDADDAFHSEAEIVEGFAAAGPGDWFFNLDWIIKFPTRADADIFIEELQTDSDYSGFDIVENPDGSLKLVLEGYDLATLSTDNLFVMVLP